MKMESGLSKAPKRKDLRIKGAESDRSELQLKTLLFRENTFAKCVLQMSEEKQLSFFDCVVKGQYRQHT